MNLRNNNGYAGIDISVALLIIVIFITTIFGVVYNIEKTNNAVRRESKAVSIITDILETAKTYGKTDVKLENKESFSNEMENKQYKNTQSTLEPTGDIIKQYSFEDENKEHYKIDITLSYPNNEENELVRKITVSVEYPVGNNTKTVEISSILQAS